MSSFIQSLFSSYPVYGQGDCEVQPQRLDTMDGRKLSYCRENTACAPQAQSRASNPQSQQWRSTVTSSNQATHATLKHRQMFWRSVEYIVIAPAVIIAQ